MPLSGIVDFTTLHETQSILQLVRGLQEKSRHFATGVQRIFGIDRVNVGCLFARVCLGCRSWLAVGGILTPKTMHGADNELVPLPKECVADWPYGCSVVGEEAITGTMEDSSCRREASRLFPKPRDDAICMTDQ